MSDRRKFARDLTPEQAERLRPIVERLLEQPDERGKRLTQAELGKLIDLDQSSVSKFRKGTTGMSLVRAWMLCDLADVDPTEIGVRLPREKTDSKDLAFALRRLPNLEKAIMRAKNTHSAATVMRAVRNAEASGTEEKLTVEQWIALLDEMAEE